jgi:hypothetical protein
MVEPGDIRIVSAEGEAVVFRLPIDCGDLVLHEEDLISPDRGFQSVRSIIGNVSLEFVLTESRFGSTIRIGRDVHAPEDAEGDIEKMDISPMEASTSVTDDLVVDAIRLSN